MGSPIADIEEAKRKALQRDIERIEKQEAEQQDPFPQDAYKAAREALHPIRSEFARSRTGGGVSKDQLEKIALKALPKDSPDALKAAAKELAAEFAISGNLARVEQRIRESSIQIASDHPELGEGEDPNESDKSTEDIIAGIPRA